MLLGEYPVSGADLVVGAVAIQSERGVMIFETLQRAQLIELNVKLKAGEGSDSAFSAVFLSTHFFEFRFHSPLQFFRFNIFDMHHQ